LGKYWSRKGHREEVGNILYETDWACKGKQVARVFKERWGVRNSWGVTIIGNDGRGELKKNWSRKKAVTKPKTIEGKLRGRLQERYHTGGGKTVRKKSKKNPESGTEPGNVREHKET